MRSWVVPVLAALTSLGVGGWAMGQSVGGFQLSQDRISLDVSALQDVERALLIEGLDGRWIDDDVVQLDRSELAERIRGLDVDVDPLRLGLAFARPAVRGFRGPAGQERLVDTVVASRSLISRAQVVERSCPGKPPGERRACVALAGSLRAGARLLDQAPAACATAAAATKAFEYCDGDRCTSDQALTAFRSFDRACLATMESWKDADGRSHDANPLPPVLRGTAAGPGALSVLVMVQITDGATTTHHCGGLLLSGSRVLTARHCIFGAGPGADRRQILRDNRMQARRVSDGAVFRMLWTEDADRRAFTVSEDFIVVPVVGDTSSAQRVRFERVPLATPALAMSHFVNFDQTRVRPETGELLTLSAQGWRAGLRWSAPGTCLAVQEAGGCVRTVCQTTNGFSGTPLFSDRSDGALVVYGLISQAQTADSLRCDAPSLRDPQGVNGDTVSTAAAFPAGVQP